MDRWHRQMGRAFAAWIALTTVLGGCHSTADIGSNVLWHAEHETGDLSEWLADMSGATVSRPPTVVAGPAHSGKFGVHLGIFNEPEIWRHGRFPIEAYYSAWLYLPHPYDEITSWTVMAFGSWVEGADAGVAADGGTPLASGTKKEVTILNLRTLPSGKIVLFVFDDRLANLQWPISVPPPVVPIAQWFHVEVFYRNANDDSGRMRVWLDGAEIYDIPNRASGVTSDMYWALGNVPDVVTPPLADIYFDDAVISLSRVGPNGRLGATPGSTPTLDASTDQD